MLRLIYSNDSNLDRFIGNFVRALNNGDTGKKEGALISTVATAIRQGVTADEVIAAFSRRGVKGKRFRQSIVNRFLLAQAI